MGEGVPWARLFERAAGRDVSVAEIRACLAERRERAEGDEDA